MSHRPDGKGTRGTGLSFVGEELTTKPRPPPTRVQEGPYWREDPTLAQVDLLTGGDRKFRVPGKTSDGPETGRDDYWFRKEGEGLLSH